MRKKIQIKKGFLITCIITSLLILHAQMALAQNAKGINCNEVSTAKTGFYVILEEPIGPDSENVKTCFRECVFDPEKKMRVCDIVDSCNQKERCGDSPSGDCLFSCQRIQVMYAESGTDLINTYVGMIYKWLAGTIGIVAVLIIVFSGISIIMAGGDTAQRDEAKKRIVRALTGLVILFLSGLILYTINPTFFV
jgi:hypothetical protein